MKFDEIVKRRRAVNFFDKNRDVPEDLLRRMIELAATAPSSFNLQPWHLKVLRDPDSKTRLRQLAMDQPKVTEAPVILIVLADPTGWQAGHPYLERNWREMVSSGAMEEGQRDWFLDTVQSLYGRSDEASLAFAVKNAAFFAMGLMYAATSLGLDTHPMDGFDHEGVRRALDIPNHFWIPLLLAVGYRDPRAEPMPPKWRKSVAEIIGGG